MSRGYVREGRRTSRAAGIFGVWLAPTHVWAGLATPVQFIGPAGMALDFLVGACAVAAVLLSPRPAASLHETQALGPHEGLRPARDAELAQRVADVPLDRRQGDDQLRGDLGVAPAQGRLGSV